MIADPVEVDIPESAKKGTTRAKSTTTKTVAKAAKAAPAASAKSAAAKGTTVKKAVGGSASSKVASKGNVTPVKVGVKES